MMARFRRYFKYLWIRPLKVDILTLFISLTILAFICVISFSYFKNYYAILKYSRGMMERNSTAIIDDINDTQVETEQILNDTQGIFLDNRSFSIDDPQIIKYAQKVLKVNPDISTYFIAFSNGSRILAKKILSSSQTHFMTDATKPLPAGTVYCVKILNPSLKDHPETWLYTDSAFNLLGQEDILHPTFNIQDRPWYIGALKTDQIFWTEPYRFLDTQDLGITASKAIYNTSNQLQAIVGVDISFLQLTNFLSHEKIGKFGHTHISDPDGKLLVPEPNSTPNSRHLQKIIQAAVNHYKKTGNTNISFSANDERYLSYIGILPSIFGKKWKIVTIVQFSNFYSDLIGTQFQIIAITVFILVLSILVIIYFSKRISEPITELSTEIDKVTNLDLASRKRIRSHIVEIRLIDSSVAAMGSAIRSFSRYVPKEIVKQLLAQGKDLKLSVEKKRLTIFFTDIQDFTTIAESHSLNILMPLLNEYFDGLSKIILKFWHH